MRRIVFSLKSMCGLLAGSCGCSGGMVPSRARRIAEHLVAARAGLRAGSAAPDPDRRCDRRRRTRPPFRRRSVRRPAARSRDNSGASPAPASRKSVTAERCSIRVKPLRSMRQARLRPGVVNVDAMRIVVMGRRFPLIFVDRGRAVSRIDVGERAFDEGHRRSGFGHVPLPISFPPRHDNNSRGDIVDHAGEMPMSLHPGAAAWLDLMKNLPPTHTLPVDVVRAAGAARLKLLPPPPAVAHVVNRDVPGPRGADPDPPLHAVRYRPVSDHRLISTAAALSSARSTAATRRAAISVSTQQPNRVGRLSACAGASLPRAHPTIAMPRRMWVAQHAGEIGGDGRRIAVAGRQRRRQSRRRRRAARARRGRAARFAASFSTAR